MILLPKYKMFKEVMAILVVVTITMEANIRPYDSTVLKQIQDQSKLKENHCFFSLEPKTRSKIISLGIRAQLRLYRRLRGGECLFQRLHSIVNNCGQHIHTLRWGIDKAILHYPTKNSSYELNHPFTVQGSTADQLSTRLKPFKWKLPHITLTYVLLLKHGLNKKTILACCPPNYKAFSMPRPNKTGSGIAIIYKDRLKVNQNNTY